MKKNLKLIIFLSVQFSLIISICLIVLFAGKKNYTVTFNLNGGECIGGEVVQSVRYGESANPPAVTREGHSFVGWDRAYNTITGDIEVFALWRIETTYGIEFEEVGNYCLVSGCFDDLSGNVYIAPFYNGKKVLGIKDGAFKGNKKITGMFLCDGLLSIGDEAFSGCSGLKVAYIPSTVEEIGKKALYGCYKLKALSIPFVGNSVHNNTSPYFGYLFGGTSFSNGYRMVPASLKNVDINSKHDIPDYAFYKCSNIVNFNIFGAINKIGNNAFRNCKGMASIILPNTITSIGKAAFANCISLPGINLPYNLGKVEEAMFANCTSLQAIIIEPKLKEIAENAFQNCINLKEFIINENDNFIFKNNKLYFAEDDTVKEYIIVMEEYKDEVDSLKEDLPPFYFEVGKFPLIRDDLIIDNDKILDIENAIKK